MAIFGAAAFYVFNTMHISARPFLIAIAASAKLIQLEHRMRNKIKAIRCIKTLCTHRAPFVLILLSCFDNFFIRREMENSKMITLASAQSLKREKIKFQSTIVME